MARVIATSNGIAAASSTVADPAAADPAPGPRRPSGGGTRRQGATGSPHPEQGPHVVEDAVEQVGDRAVARPGEGE